MINRKIAFGRKVVNLHNPFLHNKEVLFHEKSYQKVNKWNISSSIVAWLPWYFSQQAGASLLPQDTALACFAGQPGACLCFWWISWCLFSAAAPNLASTEIPLAHHPDPQLKRLLCFPVWVWFSNGWQPKKTVDSLWCLCAHGCCSQS